MVNVTISPENKGHSNVMMIGKIMQNKLITMSLLLTWWYIKLFFYVNYMYMVHCVKLAVFIDENYIMCSIVKLFSCVYSHR